MIAEFLGGLFVTLIGVKFYLGKFSWECQKNWEISTYENTGSEDLKGSEWHDDFRWSLKLDDTFDPKNGLIWSALTYWTQNVFCYWKSQFMSHKL